MRATSSSSRSVICARVSQRLTRNRSARSSIASSARAGSRARQRGDRVHAVEEEVRADARLQRTDARARLELDVAPPLVRDVEVAQRERTDDRADAEVRQQERPVLAREEAATARRSGRSPGSGRASSTPSETSATVSDDQRQRDRRRRPQASAARARAARGTARRRTAGPSRAGTARCARGRSRSSPRAAGARASARRRAAPTISTSVEHGARRAEVRQVERCAGPPAGAGAAARSSARAGRRRPCAPARTARP